MLKNKLIALAVVAAFASAPTLGFAGDAPKVSYSAKKSGGVVFKGKAQDEVSAMVDTTAEGFNPADIEPAAGADEAVEIMEENSVADGIKLPRKN